MQFYFLKYFVILNIQEYYYIFFNDKLMLLQQANIFEPTKYAYFPNSQIPCIQIHPNLQYIAFSTRAHELILHNKKTGRTSNLYQSEHGIIDIKFTSDLILVIQKGYHEILCFSLKTQKLKKKITGNRTQILKISYSRQRGLFCVITHDNCSIYNEFTLNRQKLLKCSTSSFVDCLFNDKGKYLFTAFKDSTFFIWDLDNYSYEQTQCEGKNLKIAANSSIYVSLYNKNDIYIGNLNKITQHGVAGFQQKIDRFWDSQLVRVDFIENVIIIQSQTQLYIAQLEYQNNNKFVLHNVKAVEGIVNTFRIASYGSVILLLSNGAKKISCLQLVDENRKVIGSPKNPLTNQGLNCCGGYSNTNGCIATDNIQMTEINGIDRVNPQTLLTNTYKQQTTAHYSQQKFQQFLSKHHIFPDKHRASAYRFLLQLPINPQQFLKIQSKGIHECVQFLQKRYPLQNKKMTMIMKNIISWLCFIDPVYAQIQQLPQLLFPFICLFGQDQYLCFQIVYRLLTHWLSFLVQEFPVANSKFLQNIYQILQKRDPQMIMFLKSKNITFTKLTWSMLSTFFTSNLPKQAFLAVLDNLISRPKQPQFIMFILLGYLSYNRSRILSLKSEQDLQKFLQQQHTVNTAKFMNHVFLYHQNYSTEITYKFNTINFNEREYKIMKHYPKDAVLMYRGRRKLLFEEYRKQDQQDTYKSKLTTQMQKMTLQAKRNAQRQMIMAESFNYHVQNEQKSQIQQFDSKKKSKTRSQRIKRLQTLIQELTQALKNQKQAKSFYKQNHSSNSFSISTNLYDQSDRQLQQLQLKLLKQLTSIKPVSKKPFTSIPVSGFKEGSLSQSGQHSSNAFKALMNAQITNKMWQLDSLDNMRQQQQWQNQMLRSMRV